MTDMKSGMLRYELNTRIHETPKTRIKT